MAKNKFGKTVKVDKPYATFHDPRTDWTWAILKTYQSKEGESKNQYSRWYTACSSPLTYGSWEYGDTYVKDIISNGQIVSATDEWLEEYYDTTSIEKAREKFYKIWKDIKNMRGYGSWT